MFPSLRDRLGTVLLSRLDLLLEFTTLGELGLDSHGRPVTLVVETCTTIRRQRGDCATVPRPRPSI